MLTFLSIFSLSPSLVLVFPFYVVCQRVYVEAVASEGCSCCRWHSLEMTESFSSLSTGEAQDVGRGSRVQRWSSRLAASFNPIQIPFSWNFMRALKVSISILSQGYQSDTLLLIFFATKQPAATCWGWLACHGGLQNQRSIFMQHPSLCVNAQPAGWEDFSTGSLRKPGRMAWSAHRSAVWEKTINNINK